MNTIEPMVEARWKSFLKAGVFRCRGGAVGVRLRLFCAKLQQIRMSGGGDLQMNNG